MGGCSSKGGGAGGRGSEVAHPRPLPGRPTSSVGKSSYSLSAADIRASDAPTHRSSQQKKSFLKSMFFGSRVSSGTRSSTRRSTKDSTPDWGIAVRVRMMTGAQKNARARRMDEERAGAGKMRGMARVGSFFGFKSNDHDPEVEGAGRSHNVMFGIARAASSFLALASGSGSQSRVAPGESSLGSPSASISSEKGGPINRRRAPRGPAAT